MSEHVRVPPMFREAVERMCKKIGGVENDDGCALIANRMLLMDIEFDLCRFIDEIRADQRPTILLHEGDLANGIPTVWLLGWSALESTSPHDHGESEAAIAVLRGTVADMGYTCGPEQRMRDCKEGGLPVYTIDRRYLQGTVVTMPYEYVHDMFGTSNTKQRRDITVHAYWPPLVEMGYFETKPDHKLHHTRVWRKDPKDERKETLST